MKRNPLQQKGHSLIEAMIAMTLALLVLSFLVTIFQGTRETSIKTNELIGLQETGRAVFQLIKQDLQASDAKILDPNTIPNDVLLQQQPNSDLLVLESNSNKIIYWISQSKRTDKYQQKIMELNRRDLSLNIYNQIAVVDGVTSFNVEYGELENGHLKFMLPSEINNWNKVCLIKIHLIATQLQQKKNFEFTLGVSSCNKKALF